MQTPSVRRTPNLLTSDLSVETTGTREVPGADADLAPRRTRLASLLEKHGLGLLMAVATTVTMAWGLARVALWLDEGATAVALQRTWPDLWTLRQGPEAPLLPYYVLLKAFSGVARQIVPMLESHPEVLFRLPSVIATVLAGWALIAWLSRYVPARVVAATGALLLLTGGFTRYGQEARPYAAVLFAAVVCTIVWSVLINDPRRRWLVAYTLSVAVLVALHTLSAGLVLAHLVAAIVCIGPGERRSAFVRTAFTAFLGALLVSPLALISTQNGTGPQYVYPDVTLHDAATVFLRLFTLSDHPFPGAGSVIVLAAIGLLRVNSEQYRFIARLAACWALMPAVALLVVLLVHPNLLFERYVLFVLPAWAILAGIGVVTVADLSRAAVARLPRPSTALATAVSGAVALALLAGVALDQASTHREIRALGGHSEDIRPALALSVRPEYAALPIVVSSRFGSVLVGAYAQAEEKRLVTQRVQRTDSIIWPVGKPSKVYKRILNRRDRVILLQRASAASGCEQLQPMSADQLEQCQPGILKTLDYRVERIERVGPGWTFAILERDTKSTE